MERSDIISANVDRVMTLLEKWKPYIYKEAKTGSVYVKFPDWRLGSIRFGDHTGRQKYTYRWNFDATNADRFEFKTDRDVERLFFGECYIGKFIQVFERAAEFRGVKPGSSQKFMQERYVNGSSNN